MASLVKTNKANVKIFGSEAEVIEGLCSLVVEQANKAIVENGKCVIGLSGGSLSKYLCQGLPSCKTDWSKWRFYFCDERHVSFDDPECTYKYYLDNLVSKIGIQKDQIFPDNPDIPVEEAAREYEAKLRAEFGADTALPRFDILLLGMGPDGHTCSLFPGHPLVEEKAKWVAAISDSPKPPPQRITLTLPVLLNAKCAVFTSCGAGKAEMVKRVLEDQEDPPLPASLVQPNNGDLFWILDKPAAAQLSAR